MSETKVKFCKDCRYSMKGVGGYDKKVLLCVHPKNGLVEPETFFVDGQTPRTIRRRCTTVRYTKNPNQCGQDGLWFEPKELSLWSRLLQKMMLRLVSRRSKPITTPASPP